MRPTHRRPERRRCPGRGLRADTFRRRATAFYRRRVPVPVRRVRVPPRALARDTSVVHPEDRVKARSSTGTAVQRQDHHSDTRPTRSRTRTAELAWPPPGTAPVGERDRGRPQGRPVRPTGRRRRHGRCGDVRPNLRRTHGNFAVQARGAGRAPGPTSLSGHVQHGPTELISGAGTDGLVRRAACRLKRKSHRGRPGRGYQGQLCGHGQVATGGDDRGSAHEQCCRGSGDVERERCSDRGDSAVVGVS